MSILTHWSRLSGVISCPGRLLLLSAPPGLLDVSLCLNIGWLVAGSLPLLSSVSKACRPHWLQIHLLLEMLKENEADNENKKTDFEITCCGIICRYEFLTVLKHERTECYGCQKGENSMAHTHTHTHTHTHITKQVKSHTREAAFQILHFLLHLHVWFLPQDIASSNDDGHNDDADNDSNNRLAVRIMVRRA